MTLANIKINIVPNIIRRPGLTFLQKWQIRLSFMYISVMKIEGHLIDGKYNGRHLWMFDSRARRVQAEIKSLLAEIGLEKMTKSEMEEINGGNDLRTGLQLLGEKTEQILRDINDARADKRASDKCKQRDCASARPAIECIILDNSFKQEQEIYSFSTATFSG
jgi:hypothetical protein